MKSQVVADVCVGLIATMVAGGLWDLGLEKAWVLVLFGSVVTVALTLHAAVVLKLVRRAC